MIRVFALSDCDTFTHSSNAPSVHFEVHIGLGRVVALYYRSSTLYQIRYHIRCIRF